jgi:branched-chain amino acid transport system permease protein
MEHLRYNTKLFQYIAFVLSGLFAGVAGVLYAPFVGAVVPTNLGALISATVTLMCIIGGVRIFWGGIFVLTVLFLPGGIWHYITKLWNRVRYSYGSVEAG